MVLEFINVVTITGGSEILRSQCIEEIEDYEQVGLCYDRITNSEDSTKLNITTHYSPIDNILLDLCPKYLALNFTVEFKPKSDDSILKDWRGCIRVEDQIMHFSDNYEASEGYELGSIYKLTVEGGFPDCLADFQK
jgi:hypothetical protein